MILTLRRDVFLPKATLSVLLISYDSGLLYTAGGWKPFNLAQPNTYLRLPFGFVCEDADRGLDASDAASLARKIKGETCIPLSPSEGYRVTRTPSVRFAKMCADKKMIEVQHVPAYAGIRFHPGNGNVDTEGCPLPGLDRNVLAGTVAKSVTAWEWLNNRVAECDARKEAVILHIEREPVAWAKAPHNPLRTG